MIQSGCFRYVDIHSHQTGSTVKEQLVIRNILYQDARLEAVFPDYVSIGLHPWHSEAYEFHSETFIKLMSKAGVLAVGEIGLDKTKVQDRDRQLDVFIKQARIADELGKPVILHCVKSHENLLSVHKILKPRVPWIIHGFRGSPDLAAQMIRKDFYCSFGEALLQGSAQLTNALKCVPLDHLFFETDAGTTPIESIYDAASAILQISVEELQMNLFQNFTRIFKEDV